MNQIETYVITVTVIFIVIVTGLFIFTYTFFKRQVENRHKMDEIRTKNEVRLLQATLETQERERARIGANLHDDIGPLLSSIKMYFKNEVASTQGEEKEEMEAYLQVLNDNIEQVRDFSRDLLPSVLKQFGLKASLEELSRRFMKSGDIEISINGDEITNLNNPINLSLYRIIQEAITNAIRHGEAKNIWVKFISSPQEKILIKDDGKGFNLSNFKAGLGINNMEARTKSINYVMEINSKVGQGTTITLVNAKNQKKKKKEERL